MSEAMGVPVTAPAGRRLSTPFTALVGYTLRACLPVRRWFGVLLPCAGALLFGWLSASDSRSAEAAFGDVAEIGLFGLVLPLTCLVIGDAASFLLGAALIALVHPHAGREPDRQADRAPEAAHSPGTDPRRAGVVGDRAAVGDWGCRAMVGLSPRGARGEPWSRRRRPAP